MCYLTLKTTTYKLTLFLLLLIHNGIGLSSLHLEGCKSWESQRWTPAHCYEVHNNSKEPQKSEPQPTPMELPPKVMLLIINPCLRGNIVPSYLLSQGWPALSLHSPSLLAVGLWRGNRGEIWKAEHNVPSVKHDKCFLDLLRPTQGRRTLDY